MKSLFLYPGKMLTYKELMTEFKKFDSGKLKYSIFPDSVLRDIIKIMMFGAKKYGMDNWKLCEDNTRYYDALRRHLDDWRNEDYYDKESGEPHLAHALCNLVFLHYLEEQKRKSHDIKPNKASSYD